MSKTLNAASRTRGLISAVRADGTPAGILAELNNAFNEFRAQNNKRLDQLEQGREDPVTVEQVNALNDKIAQLEAALEKTNLAAAASDIGGAANVTPEVAAHSQAFNQYFRRGVDANLADLEVRAKLQTSSDPDGGFVVPSEMESGIDRVLTKVSGMRDISRVQPLSTGEYKKLVNLGGAGSGWVGEEEGRDETNTPTLAQLAFTVMEMYAQPRATQTLLDDAAIDIAEWLAEEVSIEFSEKEGQAFIDGDGHQKPKGFLSYEQVPDDSWSWGKLGFVKSGNANAFPAASASASPADSLVNLYYALKTQMQPNARFMMNRKTLGKIRQFKDGDGNYIFSPPSASGELGTVLGKPVSVDDYMPDIAANATPIAYGNFQRGYLILDRQGIRVLRDPYTNKPFVSFYTTKRVGGGVAHFEAIKLLKIAA